MSDPINDIKATRDKAIASVDDAIDTAWEVIQTTPFGPYRTRLVARRYALLREREEIFQLATDAALALPEVIAAASRLKTLGDRLAERAKELPAATNFLTKSAQVLDLANQTADIFAHRQSKVT